MSLPSSPVSSGSGGRSIASPISEAGDMSPDCGMSSDHGNKMSDDDERGTVVYDVSNLLKCSEDVIIQTNDQF